MTEKITASAIQELRRRTGVGMAKCKVALTEAGGDIDQAIANLRKAGMASAVKKEGRETNEGLIGVAESDGAVALIEVRTETDFVAKNDKFQGFVQNLVQEAAQTQPVSLEAFMEQTFSQDSAMTIEQYRAVTVQDLGENIQVKRLEVFAKAPESSWGIYSHMGGKIVTTVEIVGAQGEEDFAREIAMHTAAEAPEYLSPEEVPADVKKHEEEIARHQVQNKPVNIIEKIVEGKVNAFFDQNCLLRQKYIKDTNISIAELVASRSKELGANLSLKSFQRWSIGA